MCAIDGSNYLQIPIGLDIPKDKDDIIAAVAACREFDASILRARRRQHWPAKLLIKSGRDPLSSFRIIAFGSVRAES
jgi:hypothetical protein